MFSIFFPSRDVFFLWVFPSPGEAYFPSPVERAAAAQVLSGELSRFKRVVSERVDERVRKGATGEGGAGTGGEEGREAQRVLIRLGGFKALDQSVAVTREVADFCRAVEEVKKGAAAAATATPPAAAAPADARVGVVAGKRSGDVGGGSGGEAGGVGGGASVRARLFEPAFLLILHSLEVRFRVKVSSCAPILLMVRAVGEVILFFFRTCFFPLLFFQALVLLRSQSPFFPLCSLGFLRHFFGSTFLLCVSNERFFFLSSCFLEHLVYVDK